MLFFFARLWMKRRIRKLLQDREYNSRSILDNRYRYRELDQLRFDTTLSDDPYVVYKQQVLPKEALLTLLKSEMEGFQKQIKIDEEANEVLQSRMIDLFRKEGRIYYV